jgi:hypothetical protein
MDTPNEIKRIIVNGRKTGLLVVNRGKDVESPIGIRIPGCAIGLCFKTYEALENYIHEDHPGDEITYETVVFD